MKKFLKSFLFAALGVFAFSSCDDVPEPYTIPNADKQEETPQVTEITCAQAVELTNALADGATSTEAYAITGYITEVVGSVSKNQQTFWMADSKEGGKVFEAYYANLPEGVTEFTAGTKVKITGYLMKFLNKNGQVVPECKNPKVEILEDNGGNGETPVATEVTCAQAVELTNALADGATSTDTYAVTGYITEIVGSVSKNQQTFWMADTKDGGKVFEAYYANLPEGVSEFKTGTKVKITGKLMKFLNKDGQVVPEIKNANVEILEDNGDSGETPVAKEVTCTQAVELTNALADGATSTDTYAVTGYITEIIGKVSKNQQSFWMADAKDGGQIFQAYYANLPEGTTQFTKGAKVKITGKLQKYVDKDNNVTPEIKNATVIILEASEETPDTPDTPDTPSDPVEGTTITSAQIVSGQSGSVALDTNKYGSQDVNTESTWYTFTVNGVTFTGCKICIATESNGGGIQIQGNASDATKQGFITNVTPFDGIKAIALTFRVVNTSTYDPGFHLYAGTATHPTSNAIEGSSTKTADGNFNVYTYTFDLSAGNYSYFTISNDLVGALYLDKIVVATK